MLPLYPVMNRGWVFWPHFVCWPTFSWKWTGCHWETGLGKQHRPRAVWSGSTLFAIQSASFGLTAVHCMLKPHCSNFRIIAAIFPSVQILGFFYGSFSGRGTGCNWGTAEERTGTEEEEGTGRQSHSWTDERTGTVKIWKIVWLVVLVLLPFDTL